MIGCGQATITDAAFVHTRGIHTLEMTNCNQATITDAAFIHLGGINTLTATNSNETTITRAAVLPLLEFPTENKIERLQLTILWWD